MLKVAAISVVSAVKWTDLTILRHDNYYEFDPDNLLADLPGGAILGDSDLRMLSSSELSTGFTHSRRLK